MWGGNWDRCQEAVEAVLNGTEIRQLTAEDGGAAESHAVTPFKVCDIRHISKEPPAAVHRARSRNRFKRTGPVQNRSVDAMATEEPARFSLSGWGFDGSEGSVGLERAPSNGSTMLETVEQYYANRDEPGGGSGNEAGNELLLDLTLGV
ncbi:unnamed protein product [Cuscuta campestris]|uniref:LOB domain-containing protein n=1 Tax=Cuscuta campestris TaxID=132261 RepID=A0A484KRK2_9ASTE|nr:unnamed protein product [Cuscuta campestris]